MENGRQPLIGELGVCRGLVPADSADGIVGLSFGERAQFPRCRAGPAGPVAEALDDIERRPPIFPVAVTARIDESLEFAIRDFVAVHPEVRQLGRPCLVARPSSAHVNHTGRRLSGSAKRDDRPDCRGAFCGVEAVLDEPPPQLARWNARAGDRDTADQHPGTVDVVVILEIDVRADGLVHGEGHRRGAERPLHARVAGRNGRGSLPEPIRVDILAGAGEPLDFRQRSLDHRRRLPAAHHDPRNPDHDHERRRRGHSQVAGRARRPWRCTCGREVSKLVEQFNGRWITARLIFFEAAVDDVPEGFGHVRPNVLQRRRLIAHDRVHRRPLGLATERPASGEELVQHDAEREDVRPRIDRLPERLFGRHVAAGADDHSGPGMRFPGHGRGSGSPGRLGGRFRQAEIEHLDQALARHHHVCRLQVAMNDIGGV